MLLPTVPDDSTIAQPIKGFNAGTKSDDENNSWEDELSESDRGAGEYYNEEDDEEDVTAYGNDYDEEDDDEDDYGYEQRRKRIRASKNAKKYYNLERFLAKKENQNKIVMNVYCTDYGVVKKAAKKVGKYKLIEVIEYPDGGVKNR